MIEAARHDESTKSRVAIRSLGRRKSRSARPGGRLRGARECHKRSFVRAVAARTRLACLFCGVPRIQAFEAGVAPEIAFAVAKTGVFLMKENEHLYLNEAKAEFQAAAEEYRERASRHDS